MARTPLVRREQPVELAVDLVVRLVVHWRDDGRLALLFPPGSVPADENDIVAPMPSRYSGPLSLDTARSRMDVLDHRFLYFVDAENHRGNVVYMRFDGDHGLVQAP